jgi:hypothetical protein
MELLGYAYFDADRLKLVQAPTPPSWAFPIYRQEQPA